MNKHLICILGPTASGKTSAAIEVAQHFNTEILSCDSRQFYKEMHIGTAVPSPEELASVPHHAIQHISIHQPYSVGQFEQEGLLVLDHIFAKQDYAVMVGGSGLYAKAIIEGLDEFPDISPEVKQEVNDTPIDKLLQIIHTNDPSCYQTIDKQNPARLRRAAEVILQTKLPYSSFLAQEKKARPFTPHLFVIDWEREALYQRINQRVDFMIEQGLVSEVKLLFKYRHLNSLNTVGYAEIFNYLLEEYSLEEAVELIKRNTRRYAKRQLTWFRKQKDATWISPECFSERVIGEIEDLSKDVMS